MIVTELRIRNKLKWAAHNTIVSIHGIYFDDEDGEYVVNYFDHETTNMNTIQLSAFESIPLTPEWLERFGFLKDDLLDDWYILGFNGITLSGNFIFTIEIGTTKIILKYVHQLQNLYQALTQKELELKPITDKQP